MNNIHYGSEILEEFKQGLHECKNKNKGILVVLHGFWRVGVFKEDQSDHLFSYVPIKFCCLCGIKLE